MSFCDLAREKAHLLSTKMLALLQAGLLPVLIRPTVGGVKGLEHRMAPHTLKSHGPHNIDVQTHCILICFSLSSSELCELLTHFYFGDCKC